MSRPPILASDRAGVAGQVVARFPADFAGRLVEGHDGRAVGLDAALRGVHVGRAAGRTAADVDEQQVAPHQRRAADAEEVLHDVELLHRVDPPHRLAVGDADALQHAFGAERVDVRAIDDRRRPRAVVVAEHVFVVGRIVAGPDWSPGLGVEAGQPLVVVEAGEVIEPAVGDGRRGVAGADRRSARRSAGRRRATRSASRVRPTCRCDRGPESRANHAARPALNCVARPEAPPKGVANRHCAQQPRPAPSA